MVMEIEVTQADIQRSTRRDSTGCAIVIAASRATGVPIGKLYAHSNKIGFYFRVDRQRFGDLRLPVEAETWMRNYDLGYSVEPFTFSVGG